MRLLAHALATRALRRSSCEERVVGSTLPASRVNGLQAMSLYKSHFRPHCTKAAYNASDEVASRNATKRLPDLAISRIFQEIEPLATSAEFVRRSRLAIAQRAVAHRTSPAMSDFATEGNGS